MTELRRAALVLSQGGPQGGFRLARPAAEIPLADVIRAINGPRIGSKQGTGGGETLLG